MLSKSVPVLRLFGYGVDIEEAIKMSHVTNDASDLPVPESLGVASTDKYDSHF